MTAHRTPHAVLFDRDGTLIEDVPYNGDPRFVRPLPGAREGLLEVRRHGLRAGVVTNQSGLAQGLFDPEQMRQVHARIDELIGPFDAWAVCPHHPDDGCPCRKPAPGLVIEAAARLGVRPDQCAVIGDIGSDMYAARAAGALGILVPTPRTREAEIEAEHRVAPNLLTAVHWLLGDRQVIS